MRGVPAALSGGKGDSLNVRSIGQWPYGPPYAVVVEGDNTYLGSGEEYTSLTFQILHHLPRLLRLTPPE